MLLSNLTDMHVRILRNKKNVYIISMFNLPAMYCQNIHKNDCHNKINNVNL